MGAKSVAFAILLLMAPVTVAAQNYAIQGIEHYLRVEASTSQGRRGPVVAGYVHNLYGHPIDGVRLALETLDASGKVTSTKFVYVAGSVPVDGRGYFEELAPAAGTNYRVRALSFNPIARGGA
jgi:hypothetical protein